MNKVELWTIILPTQWNHPKGKNPYIRLAHHRVWDKFVRSISGGLTILHPARGQWTSIEGKIYLERVIPVMIACNKEQIEKIADFSAKHYLQEAIMYYRVSDYVVIKDYPENKSL
jgi:hypothetical protein